jgi:N-acetylglucosaminyl-diphospho-decaprenol L-rhamnosyltransferase
MYDVGVIIVNYKMKQQVDTCLFSLFEDIKNSALSVKVVLLDNNSEEEIEKMLGEKYPLVETILFSENKGMGVAQNIGMKHVDAKYYFILNPDTYFHEGTHTVQKLHSFLETNSKIGLIGPKIFYPDGALQYSCWRFPSLLQPLYQRTKLGKTKYGQKKVAIHHMKDFDHESTRPVDALMGSALFVRKSALDIVGGFDERFFMYYEDVDWSRRMWEFGFPVYYVHDIALTHAHGRGSAAVPGILKPLLKNKLARIHLMSWFKYLRKWHGQDKYYGSKT